MYTPATSSEETLHFPLTLRMKLMALAPQFYVSDKNNRPIAYIKQKLFKLKEDIRRQHEYGTERPVFVCEGLLRAQASHGSAQAYFCTTGSPNQTFS